MQNADISTDAMPAEANTTNSNTHSQHMRQNVPNSGGNQIPNSYVSGIHGNNPAYESSHVNNIQGSQVQVVHVHHSIEPTMTRSTVPIPGGNYITTPGPFNYPVQPFSLLPNQSKPSSYF